MVNITTVATFQGRQQKKPATTEDKTRQDDVTVAEIEVGIKALDRHIESLKAKPSFLVRLYDD